MSEAENQMFNFKMDINNLNSKAVGVILGKDLKEMTLPQFEEFDKRLVKVVRRKRFDTIVFKNEVIPAGFIHRVFHKGLGQVNTKFNDKSAAGEYDVTRRHSNMQLNGSFQQGDVTIIRAIEIPVVFPSCPPTAAVNGIVTNPTAITNKTNYSAGSMAHHFPKAFEVRYFELGKQKIPSSSMDDFGMIEGGVAGYAGASPDGVASNALLPRKTEAMNKVRILIGDSNFYLEVESIQEFNMTSYGLEFGVPVILHTTELESNTP
jgi:signal peptidase I